MTKRVAILFSGGGSNMVSLLESMKGEHPCKPVLALSNNADAGGLTKAQAAGVETAVIDHRPYGADRAGFEAQITMALEAHRIDIICLAGFMRILTPEFATYWQGRVLNIHPSLLPKYKGLHTHQRALDAGDKDAGCSVHEVTGELDGGPVLGQGRVPVIPGDTADTLRARVLGMEHRLYPAVLRAFATGDTRPVNLT